ncbi:tryptophan 7-halogenase [Psychrosphaera sp. 1_MG-2023]|uniref:tryptophan halogenase family protein n=1 Tax=Psychrosphaera sp. 1_MG-2023 TaxID=3062643 RepID=UPI0026E1F108|nr:tryptophan halogenase family protein [Psychrosphaera sp. 1_MG-2023]MDO6718674.1 tryptophan 7-halogenase [Psychrosphaera sp. 1_MG-2023]
MSDKRIKNIIILGGGTAGWMTAATMGKLLKQNYCNIRLIESDDISTVGVGEATIPQIQIFNRTLGIDENEFIKRTQGTFKLGIEFVNWGQIGDKYTHAFGEIGQNIDGIPFFHYWWKMRQKNKVPDIGAYSLNTIAGHQNKFMRSIDAGNSPLSNIAYAYQFDAGLYAKFLREYSEQRGVIRSEGKVVETRLRESDGFIESLVLESGEVVAGDLFIDCSGGRAVLIEGALKTGFDDWSHWLPCDSAWAVPCERTEPLKPYTSSTAHTAGWQWRIPLQHRTGNGHVFSSKFMSDEEALDILMNNLDGKPLAEPRLLKFSTGRRKKSWNKNCVAIGLSSGFFEPIESTNIHLVQTAIARLMVFFPDLEFNQHDIDAYNQQTDFEYCSIRDFIILHYKATERDDSAFWNHCRTMSIPDSLQQKIDQFSANGNIIRNNMELFNPTSWLEVFHGQRIHPKGYHPLVDSIPEEELERRLTFIQSVITKSVEVMPTQQEFIHQHCLAPKMDNEKS